MEGYYTIFDQVRRRVGFASSNCNSFKVGLRRSNVTGPRAFRGYGKPRDCAYVRAGHEQQTLLLTAYILGNL